MSKTQMWIVAAVVGVVAIIAGVKLFGGSADEDETARPQRLVQREAKTQPGGWSVRANSQDLPISDDVKVQRQAEAKPGSIAPPHSRQPAQPQAGQPAAGVATEAEPAQPDDGAAGTLPQANVGSGASNGNEGNDGLIARAGGTNPAAIDVNGEVIHAPSGPLVAAGSVAVSPQGGPVAPQAPPVAGAQAGGTELNPAHDQQAQATPPEVATPGGFEGGLVFDAKDEQFPLDTPVKPPDAGKINGPTGTFMMELAPGFDRDNQDDADFFKLGDNLEFHKNTTFMSLVYTDPNGTEHAVGTNMKWPVWDDIQPPYNTAVTWNSKEAWIYVNGKQVGHSTLGVPIQVPSDAQLQIGSDFREGRPVAPGQESNVKLLNTWLPPDQGVGRTAPAQPSNR